MSKWLVIGASSFTGSHFVDYLRGIGSEVEEASLREHFIAEADYIVNFAALNVVAPSWNHPVAYMQVNMPIKLWEAAKCKRYIHISTPEVYGSTSGMVREDAPYNPSTPYAVSRVAAELMLKCYHRQYGLPVLFTRSCNVYGPGQQLYRIIPKLITSIKKGIRFPLEGGGYSNRAFIHVKDDCAAIYRVAISGEVGTAYNISSPLQWSIRGLVNMVCEYMGVKFSDAIQEVPERPGKDASYRLDDTRIRRLGWNDNIEIQDGIKEVISWIEENWEQLKDQSLEYEYRA